MNDQRVLVTCKLIWDVLPSYTEDLEARDIVVVIPDVTGQALAEEELIPLVGDIVGIVAGDDAITRRVLDAAPRLKVIAKWGVGIDGIDLAAAQERGVEVFNTPGVFGDEMGDYALGFLLMLARRHHVVDREIRLGHWPKPRGTSLAGKKLGIVGLGSSGRSMARRARILGMSIIGCDPSPPDSQWLASEEVALRRFDELVQLSDVVSLHLPANSGTRGLINSSVLQRMKRGAWLINTSRGALIDEADLVEALATRHIGGAALDVYENEPLESGHPLLTLPNVILGSHNASNTHEAVARASDETIGNLLRGLEETR